MQRGLGDWHAGRHSAAIAKLESASGRGSHSLLLVRTKLTLLAMMLDRGDPRAAFDEAFRVLTELAGSSGYYDAPNSYLRLSARAIYTLGTHKDSGLSRKGPKL